MVGSASSVLVLSASTEVVDPREQFDHFCDALCDVYLGIQPQRITVGEFKADVLAYEWDDIVLSRMRAPGHDARRDRASIAGSPDDALFLNFSDDSASTLEADGRIALVRAGTPVLLDNSEPFHLRFDPAHRFHLYSLRLPREIGGRRIDSAAVAAFNDRLGGTRTGRQLALQARMMATEFNAGRTAVAGAMAHVVAALVEVLCGASERSSASERVTAYMATAAANLSDHQFGVHDIAAIHQVSTRTVQNVFAAHGETVSEWMLRERLELARSRLSDSRWRGSSIERIAHSCGVADASGFHRAFRARFGQTPGAYRPPAEG